VVAVAAVIRTLLGEGQAAAPGQQRMLQVLLTCRPSSSSMTTSIRSMRWDTTAVQQQQGMA
jgi:hypothetical protein